MKVISTVSISLDEIFSHFSKSCFQNFYNYCSSIRLSGNLQPFNARNIMTSFIIHKQYYAGRMIFDDSKVCEGIKDFFLEKNEFSI